VGYGHDMAMDMVNFEESCCDLDNDGAQVLKLSGGRSLRYADAVVKCLLDAVREILVDRGNDCNATHLK
jgi:hypothetical protein